MSVKKKNYQSLYGLPINIKFCKKCVISNQRPNSTVEFLNKKKLNKSGILFDKNGVCSACLFNEEKKKEIDWNLREKKLIKLVEKIISKRNKNTKYDIVVPGSGGKDSAFASHVLKYKYGLNVLTVTWAPHLYTEIGWKNMCNWMHVGGLDNLLYTPNGKLHRELTKNAFINLLHPFQPFIIGQRIIGPAIAMKFGIKYVFYGENQAEYGNLIEENKTPLMKKDFFSTKNFDDISLGGLKIKNYLKDKKYSILDFSPYLPPMPEEINKAEIEVHYLGYYLKWDPQECYYYACENTGFEANDQRTEGSYSKYSSIDDKIDPFHYYTTLIKFGLGRASYDAAQEVRNGKITRDEAVSLVKKYDTEFPKKFFLDFINYIGLTESEFWKTINKFRSPHVWNFKANKWQLRHTVSRNGTDD